MEILAKKLPYIKLEPKFKNWKAQEDLKDAQREKFKRNAPQNTPEILYRQKQAKALAQNILMLDNYVYDKAEDVEAVFATFNIQLLAGVSALATVPKAITKLIPVLEKKYKNSSILYGLKKYKNSEIKLGNKKLPLSTALTGATALISGLLYARGVTRSIKSQLGATRRAKFEGLTEKFSADADYAVLTNSQEQEIEKKLNDKNNPINQKRENKIPILKKLFERINIHKSLSQTTKLTKKNSEYLKNKEEFDKFVDSANFKTTKANKQMLEDMIKFVDLKSEDDLERMEKVVNVGYSSLFVGGFLEYLISDKIINMLRIKQPVIKQAAKLLIPIASYMIMNKSIAGVQNNAIKATRYKNFKKFVEDKSNFVEIPNKLPTEEIPQKEEKKPGLFKFLKGMFKDIKEYKNFEEKELQQFEKRHELKKGIILTPSQREEAQILKRNTQFTVHKEADNRRHFAQGVEAFSEIALAPIEIASTAIGAFLGSKAGAHSTNPAVKKIYMALGALLAFVPTAITEVITTAEQKKALRIASMTTIEQMNNSKMFNNIIPEQKH